MQENINIQNKKARFKYFTQKKYVAGLVLTGLQIKSIRSKNVNIDNSYCNFDSNELFLYNVNFQNIHVNKKNNTVKLLLNRNELLKIKKMDRLPYTIQKKVFLSLTQPFEEIGLNRIYN